MAKLDIVKMSILLKLIYRSSRTPTNISTGFVRGIDRVVLKCTRKWNGTTLFCPAPTANPESGTLCCIFHSCAARTSMEPDPMQNGPSIPLLIRSWMNSTVSFKHLLPTRNLVRFPRWLFRGFCPQPCGVVKKPGLASGSTPRPSTEAAFGHHPRWAVWWLWLCDSSHLRPTEEPLSWPQLTHEFWANEMTAFPNHQVLECFVKWP